MARMRDGIRRHGLDVALRRVQHPQLGGHQGGGPAQVLLQVHPLGLGLECPDVG